MQLLGEKAPATYLLVTITPPGTMYMQVIHNRIKPPAAKKHQQTNLPPPVPPAYWRQDCPGGSYEKPGEGMSGRVGEEHKPPAEEREEGQEAPYVEEAEELNQALGRAAVLEQGRGREVAKPPNGTILNQPNLNCQRGRATVGDGQPFLQYDQLAHRGRIRRPLGAYQNIVCRPACLVCKLISRKPSSPRHERKRPHGRSFMGHWSLLAKQSRRTTPEARPRGRGMGRRDRPQPRKNGKCGIGTIAQMQGDCGARGRSQKSLRDGLPAEL